MGFQCVSSEDGAWQAPCSSGRIRVNGELEARSRGELRRAGLWTGMPDRVADTRGQRHPERSADAAGIEMR